MKILVTAFDPFGGEEINPALEAVKDLPDEISEAQVIKLEIPTVFHKSADKVKQAIIDHDPDVILAIGQAGGRYGVTPERVAINVDDGRIEDNEGNQPIDSPIQADGQPAYFSSLPIKAMVEAIKAEGLPSSVSNSAGTFVCNHIMYQILYMIDKDFPGKIGGFVHVPFTSQQVVDKANQPAMSLADISRALQAAIRAIVDQDGKGDIKKVGGAIHWFKLN